MKAKLTYIVLTLVLLLSLIAVIIPTSPVSALATWYVDATHCPGPGTGTVGNPFCKIQSAIGNASADDTIIIAAGTYNEHDITINKSLTIQGAGAGSTFVDGEKLSRVFCINNSTVDMSGITIMNGNTTAFGGGIYNDRGNVTLTNCTIRDNYANDGGGIFNLVGQYDGYLTLTNCTVSGNYAINRSGGICNYANDSKGYISMTNCTISGNDAKDGGGIYNFASWANMDLEMINCTISGNDAANDGGGIYNFSSDSRDIDLVMINCTVSGNYAVDAGGGIYNHEEENADIYLSLKCTIVYSNAPNNIDGSDTSGIISESIIDSPNPLLGPLQNNGGPTETHALLAGSPAIDACTTDCPPPATDQRGLPRPVDGDLDCSAFCDVGAYEKQILAPVGGIVEPVDRMGVLAPWLGLAAFLAVAVVLLFKRRRLA
jgi:hypothetical protein